MATDRYYSRKGQGGGGLGSELTQFSKSVQVLGAFPL